MPGSSSASRPEAAAWGERVVNFEGDRETGMEMGERESTSGRGRRRGQGREKGEERGRDRARGGRPRGRVRGSFTPSGGGGLFRDSQMGVVAPGDDSSGTPKAWGELERAVEPAGEAVEEVEEEAVMSGVEVGDGEYEAGGALGAGDEDAEAEEEDAEEEGVVGEEEVEEEVEEEGEEELEAVSEAPGDWRQRLRRHLLQRDRGSFGLRGRADGRGAAARDGNIREGEGEGDVEMRDVG